MLSDECMQLIFTSPQNPLTCQHTHTPLSSHARPPDTRHSRNISPVSGSKLPQPSSSQHPSQYILFLDSILFAVLLAEAVTVVRYVSGPLVDLKVGAKARNRVSCVMTLSAHAMVVSWRLINISILFLLLRRWVLKQHCGRNINWG